MIRRAYRLLSIGTAVRALVRGPFALARWILRRTLIRWIP